MTESLGLIGWALSFSVEDKIMVKLTELGFTELGNPLLPQDEKGWKVSKDEVLVTNGRYLIWLNFVDLWAVIYKKLNHKPFDVEWDEDYELFPPGNRVWGRVSIDPEDWEHNYRYIMVVWKHHVDYYEYVKAFDLLS